MKTIILLFLLPLNLYASEVNWVEVKEAFGQYVKNPNNETAQYSISVIPEEYIYVKNKKAIEANNFIYNYNQFSMLERQVISSHRLSVRLAFRLRSFADGAFSEDISILLGTLIRINPELFLSELKRARPKVKHYSNFLNQGSVFVDRLIASCNESILRKKSLIKVKNPELNYLKEKIIVLLERNIRSSYCKKI